MNTVMSRGVRGFLFAGVLCASMAGCGGPNYAGSYSSVWSEQLTFAADDMENNDLDTTVAVSFGANNAVTFTISSSSGPCVLNGTLSGDTATITAGQTCSFNVTDTDGNASTYAYTFTGGTGQFSSTTTYTPRNQTTTTCPARRRCSTSTRVVSSASTSLYVRLTMQSMVVQTIGTDTYNASATITLSGGRTGS